MLVTNEIRDLVKQFIKDLEASISIGVHEDIGPNDRGYHDFKEQSFKDSINYAVERLFILQQEHCD